MVPAGPGCRRGRDAGEDLEEVWMDIVREMAEMRAALKEQDDYLREWVKELDERLARLETVMGSRRPVRTKAAGPKRFDDRTWLARVFLFVGPAPIPVRGLGEWEYYPTMPDPRKHRDGGTLFKLDWARVQMRFPSRKTSSDHMRTVLADMADELGGEMFVDWCDEKGGARWRPVRVYASRAGIEELCRIAGLEPEQGHRRIARIVRDGELTMADFRPVDDEEA